MQKLADDSPVECVATLCCTTGFARMTKSLTSLGPRGRIERSSVEGKWECPGIPMAISNDNADKNSRLYGVEAYA